MISAERSRYNNCRRHVHGSLSHGLLLEHPWIRNRCRKLMFVCSRALLRFYFWRLRLNCYRIDVRPCHVTNIFHLFDLANPPGVASPANGVASQTLTISKANSSGIIRSPRESICCHMFARQSRRLQIPAQSAAHARLYSQQWLPISGSAENNSPPHCPLATALAASRIKYG